MHPDYGHASRYVATCRGWRPEVEPGARLGVKGEAGSHKTLDAERLIEHRIHIDNSVLA